MKPYTFYFALYTEKFRIKFLRGGKALRGEDFISYFPPRRCIWMLQHNDGTYIRSFMRLVAVCNTEYLI
jgi:hypothetical protein